ncbi:hypothetical protein PRIC1_000396 [Phytophthora ramorum]|nr:hypothetical protein KRP23_7074 [Phytophthora ramorum]KAH7498059.1 hypothetical protein KRP22_12176 [Phytophthora ramorum]
MGVTTNSTAPNSSVEHLHNVLAYIQQLSAQAADGGRANKHQQIRVTHWARKLRSQPTSNPTWLKSVLEHANVLLQMLLEGAVEEPFTKMPPQGPLAALPRCQVARLAKAAAHFIRLPTDRTRAVPIGVQLKPPRQTTHSNNADESVQTVADVRKVSQQVQTQEEDDQWEWQRVWKGAFDKMRQQLQQMTEETEALATENKELRALVAGCEKALQEADRTQRDVVAKHVAELDNLRAVHSLELSDLQARHRQKLQQVTLQNDEKLLSRRQSRFIQPTPNSSNSPPDANADFLQYIDAFYSATLHLTAQNKA